MIHHIYVIQAENWKNRKNKPLIKIGSTNNVAARMKNLKTGNPYPILVICYYIIHNYDCYKLDNAIKVQFKHYNADLKGGIEFYETFELNELEDCFDSFNIKFEKCEKFNEKSIDDVKAEEMIDDLKMEMKCNEKSLSIEDKSEVNYYISPIGKKPVTYYNNYKKTIKEGINTLELMPEKYGIKSSYDKYYFWSTYNSKINKSVNVNDMMILTVSYDTDQHVMVTRVKEIVKSPALGKFLWNDEVLSPVFIVEKIKKINNSPKEWLDQVGYKYPVNVYSNVRVTDDKLEACKNSLS